MERSNEELGRTIPGEHAAGPVGAVRGGREADHHQAGARIAEAGYGATPVVVVPELPLLLSCDPLSIGHEPGALPAGDDVGLDLGEGVRAGLAGGQDLLDVVGEREPRRSPAPIVLTGRDLSY